MSSKGRLPASYTLFPYTTLFRSHPARVAYDADGGPGRRRQRLEEQRVRRDVQEPGVAEPRLFQVGGARSEEHTSELQSHVHIVCRLLLEKKNHGNAA